MTPNTRNNFQTAKVGRDLVLNELSSRGAQNVIQTAKGRKKVITAENVPRTRTVTIIVRTLRSGTWQVSTDDGSPIENISDETEFWIFVDLRNGENSPGYCIVPGSWMRNDIYETHKAYLEKHGGARPVTPDSPHNKIKENRISQWKDRWDILKLF